MNDLSLPERVDRSRDTVAGSLDHLALLMVRGADARTFLDSQLTRNVPSASGVASPAGYCSPKGRLLASLVIWLEDDAIALLLSREIAEAIAKRLRMYVLRAKATIEDVTGVHVIDGLVEPEFAASATMQPWSVVRADDETWIRYPDADGRRRHLRVASTARENNEGTVDAATWRRLDIRSGLAMITSATQDRFVPQMLNLEALGGVDFKKGCYPGQEVVARSQYLGKLRRRMALATLDATADVPLPGTDVWNPGANEASGIVINAERDAAGKTALLVELPVALFASNTLHAGAIDGPLLTIEPLPYPLPDNEVFVRPKL
jgi:folate-binding protein YgfZ